jgi:apolipoprotein N-acyltransferase
MAVKSFIKQTLKFILVVVLSGEMYYFANGFHNIWSLMWIAPIPLCLYALNNSFLATLFAGLLAYFIGGLSDAYVYSHTDIGATTFVYGALIHAIFYAFLLTLFRYVALRKYWFSSFIFAFIWVLYEFIFSLFSIHGTNISIAYTQLHNLPIIQIATITGIWGISFLLIFVPANIAFICHYHKNKKLALKTGIITIILLALTLSFGFYRLHSPKSKATIKVGIAAIEINRKEFLAVLNNNDQKIINNVVQRYVETIQLLAKNGAKIILLPEEVAYLQENNTKQVLNKFSFAAKKNNVYLIVGLNVKEQNKLFNSAYLFLPNGKIAFRYDKEHLLPFAKEAYYTPGNKTETLQIPNIGNIAVAICKDMDFVFPALKYSQQNVGAIFVPAWDFGYDAWIHGRMALMRGIEGNFSVIRAGKDGLLTISDNKGRIIAKAHTKDSKDKTLVIGEIPVTSGKSLYSKITHFIH